MPVYIKTKADKTTATKKQDPKAQVSVTKETVQESGEKQEEILKDEQVSTGVPTKEFTQPVANVGFSAGVTRNLGDYSSLKIQVSLHLPCYVHEIHETFDAAKEFVDNKVNEVMDEYEE